jgi:hypothetical protein
MVLLTLYGTEANEGLMNQIVEGNATTANGTFKVLWDTENLYMLIQVNDPIRSAWDLESTTVNPWNVRQCGDILWDLQSVNSTAYQKR